MRTSRKIKIRGLLCVLLTVTALLAGCGNDRNTTPDTQQQEEDGSNQATRTYYVRRTWDDPESQIAEFTNLEEAKRFADENPSYVVYNNNGVAVYRPEETPPVESTALPSSRPSATAPTDSDVTPSVDPSSTASPSPIPTRTPLPGNTTAPAIPVAPTATPVPTIRPAATPVPTPRSTSIPTAAPANSSVYIGAGSTPANYTAYYAKVDSGYLALRSAKAFDASNEIAQIDNGQAVYVISAPNETYWYVYAPTAGMYGYVNSNYLSRENSNAVSSDNPSNYYTVSVSSGYLALRSAKAYDASNEIGKLYAGDQVQVMDSSDSAYWYVYSPSLQAYGYVNRDYLISNGGGTNNNPGVYYWTVRVENGYLALRSAKAYDASNEIGKLYTGDQVQVIDTGDDAYWYVYAPSLRAYGYVNSGYLY